MKLQPKAILFDFDYTLADSSKGACECINYALARMGFAVVPEQAACETIGMSLPRTFAALVGEAHGARAEEFAGLFFERADEVMADLTAIFPEVPEVLAQIKGQGAVLGIVSTKRRHRIEEILAREGLAELFAVIVGGEDVDAHKPDPSGLLMALERLGCATSDALYVGDSTVDAETAAAAGVAFVAVLTGTTSTTAFAGTGARHVLGNIGQLPSVL